MAEIPVSGGYVAIVDDADYEHLSQFRWSLIKGKTHNYAGRTAKLADGRKRTVLMHRYLLGLEVGSPVEADHINRNTLDNRRENLRAVTRSENNRNKPKYRVSSSQYKGVSWNKRRHKWYAYIVLHKKMRSLGLYETEVEAARAYNSAAVELHGEFASLNDLPA